MVQWKCRWSRAVGPNGLKDGDGGVNIINASHSYDSMTSPARKRKDGCDGQLSTGRAYEGLLLIRQSTDFPPVIQNLFRLDEVCWMVQRTCLVIM